MLLGGLPAGEDIEGPGVDEVWLTHVYASLGPVYRKVARIVEGDEPVKRMSVGVRAVMEQLNREGERPVPQIAGSQEISWQFVQRLANDAYDAGFVEFVDNPAHRRSRLLRLDRRVQSRDPGGGGT